MKWMEDLGFVLMGFVVIDYVILIWGLDYVSDFCFLLDLKELWDGLDGWFVENVLMKCMFCGVVIIVGLIDCNLFGKCKIGW